MGDFEVDLKGTNDMLEHIGKTARDDKALMEQKLDNFRGLYMEIEVDDPNEDSDEGPCRRTIPLREYTRDKFNGVESRFHI